MEQTPKTAGVAQKALVVPGVTARRFGHRPGSVNQIATTVERVAEPGHSQKQTAQHFTTKTSYSFLPP